MKKSHVILFSILFIALVLNFASVYYSLRVYTAFNEPSLSARASDTGQLDLIVETAPTSSPSPSPSPSGGGGGSSGGGGRGTIAPQFVVSPDEINVQIVSGGSDSREINLKNNGTDTIIIDVSATTLNDYLVFDTNRVVLQKGQNKSIVVTLNAPKPGVYAGKIRFKSGSTIKETLVLLNVISEGSLFDVSITIPDAYRNLYVGENLPTLIELTKVGNAENGLDVTLNYIIKDFDGKVIYTESETLYVLGAKSFNKQFQTNRLKAGDYIVGIELIYPGGFATSSAHFRVQRVGLNWLTILAIILAFISGILVILAIRFYRKKNKHVKVAGRK